MGFYAVSPVESAKSLASSFDGASFNVGGFHSVAISNVVTSASSLNGTLKLQASVDGAAWGDVASASATITADGTTIFTIANNPYQFIRLVWTRTAGSGTLNSKAGTVMTGKF
jgi:hypothetical protein